LPEPPTDFVADHKPACVGKVKEKRPTRCRNRARGLKGDCWRSTPCPQRLKIESQLSRSRKAIAIFIGLFCGSPRKTDKDGQYDLFLLKGLIFMSKPTSQSSRDASDGSKQCPYSDEFRRDVVRLITDEGYSIAAAAKACGVSDQTVRNWYDRFAPTPEPAGDDATVEELRAEVTRLRKQLRRAELERAILENGDGVLRKGVSVKYAWINE
jgi:transposase